MKNTKKFKKINKTTKRYKGGIIKNNISPFVTQTAGYNSLFGGNQTGGQVGPAPSPAGLNISLLEPTSLRSSLQSYGDAIQSMLDTAQIGVDIYAIPPGAPTTPSANTPSYNELITQYNEAQQILDKSIDLMNKFAGPAGLYKTIYGSSVQFTATPSPAPAQSGGQTGSPPAGLVPLTNLTQSVLQSKLQAFGDAIYVLKVLTDNYNSLFNTASVLSDVSPSSTSAYTAYSAFKSQQTAADSLKDAVESTYDAFKGTTDFNRSAQTGSAGLYRAILGDSYVFTPSALPPGLTVARSSETSVGGPAPRPAPVPA